MKKLLKLLGISAIVFCAMFCTMAANAQGIGGKAGTGGKGGFGGGQASSSFSPSIAVSGGCSGNSSGCTVTLSVTAGQFAVCGVGATGTTATLTCTDSDSDTLTSPSGSPATFTSTAMGALFEGTMGNTNASEVFTCHIITGYAGCVVAVYNGIPTSGWDVAVAANSNASSACPYAVTSGTSTLTSNASELGIGLFVAVGGSTISWAGTSGWTFEVKGGSSSTINIAIVDNILSSKQTLTASATYSGCTTAAVLGMVSSIK